MITGTGVVVQEVELLLVTIASCAGVLVQVQGLWCLTPLPADSLGKVEDDVLSA